MKKDLEQKDSMKDMQKQVESVLKKQISDLQTRLNSTMVGRQSESEMYEEAVMKATHLETTVSELNAKVSARAKGQADFRTVLRDSFILIY